MTDSAPQAGLHLIDWLIIAAYGCSMLALGWYYSRRQTSQSEYFIGGGRVNPLLIGVSLFATLLSTISYLAMPGEALGKGPGHMTRLFALPVVYLIVVYVVLPVYMRQRVISAYELLEERLGLGVRLLAATMFVLMRLAWMSLAVYLTSKALAIMMGLGSEWIATLSVSVGIIAVVYTSLGGLRAIVVADIVQTVLLFGGALLVIGTVTFRVGGLSWFPTEWQEHWDAQPLFSWDPATRVTVVGSVVSLFVWFVCTSGGDQMSVQRFMATRDAAAGRRAYAMQMGLTALIGVTLALVGFALLGYLQTHGDALPESVDLNAHADDVLPRFIAYHLPVGISGFVVAALLAAGMSSIDSGVNSITAVVMTDFLRRFGRTPGTEKGQVLLAQCLAFAIGGTVVVGSSFMDDVPGNITAVTNKTTHLLTTPLFCLFFFALFVPFARPAGVLIGTACGTATAALIAFSGPIFGFDPRTGGDPVSFQWIGPAALVVNIVAGCVASLLIRGCHPPVPSLTAQAVDRRPGGGAAPRGVSPRRRAEGLRRAG